MRRIHCRREGEFGFGDGSWDGYANEGLVLVACLLSAVGERLISTIRWRSG